jgi:hypothetical protein
VKREVNEQKYELSNAWQVPVSEVEQRLVIVKSMWDKLPPDKQQAYDSPKGAQVLYARYESTSKKQGTTQSSTKKAGVSTPASKWAYTESQIQRMDQATYSANADRIMVAYAKGLVKKR